MDKVNPKFILRNYLMEEAIKQATNNNFSRVDELLDLSNNPFNETEVPDNAA